jgi:hypothetical protein
MTMNVTHAAVSSGRMKPWSGRGLLVVCVGLVIAASLAADRAVDPGLATAGDAERPADDRVESPAEPRTAADPAADELPVRYALARLRLAELDVERALEANQAVPHAIGVRELERLRNHVLVMRRHVEIARARPRTSARQATIAAVEAARESAQADLAAAVQVNHRVPGAISRVNMERLRAKADLADIRLALCRSPDCELSLLAEMQWSIDRLTDEVIDLRHQIDAKSAADLGQ